MYFSVLNPSGALMPSKLFCFYFPQFYSIPANDKYWGEGFTDWDNVKSCSPQFPGHRQPRIPLDGYYDQSSPAVIKNQARLAGEYGVDGFAFYHYWFDGELVLGKPVENFLNDTSIKLKFCFTWANETWSKRWVGEDTTIIYQQNHGDDKAEWKKHFEYLVNFFKDSRYETVNGKPIFNIYNPHLIKNSADLFSFWNHLATEQGLPGIHFNAISVTPLSDDRIGQEYLSIMDFQPRYAANAMSYSKTAFGKAIDSLRFLPEPLLNQLTKLRYSFGGKIIHKYDDVWLKIIENELGSVSQERFFGAFVDWDNTARYGKKATIYDGFSVEKFQNYLLCLLNKANGGYVFLNAWNEWSECAYLEPDQDNQYRVLEVVKSAVHSHTNKN